MEPKLSIQERDFSPHELENIKHELAKLIGLLLTDGGISIISGKHRIHFTSNSAVLISEFKGILSRIYGYKPAAEKKFNATILRAWINKKVAQDLLMLSPCYRTLAFDKEENKYPDAKIPDFIFRNEKYAKIFLKYSFTADGSVTFYIGKARYGYRFDRMIRICCEHPDLRKQYYRLLRILGFSPKLYKDCVSLRGKRNIKKFSTEIGFIENVNISGKGLWNGFMKSELLRLSVTSFDYKPSELGSSKNEIYDNLLSILASDTGDLTI